MKDPPDGGSKPPITIDKKKLLTIISAGPKYLVMNRINSDKTLAEVSPFLIKKVIDNTCGGEVEMCKKLLNGTILIKTKNYVQARNLIQLTSLSSNIEVELSEHQSLNYAKGVIYSNDLRGIEEEEIVKELKTQNVCKINKILRKVNNELKETGLIIVTFAATSLPSELSIGYEKVKIRPYIPLPLKCKNCCRFGHLAKFCNNKQTCFNCSDEFHLKDENDVCSLTQVCINCKENNNNNNNHSANDKSCPIFLKEKEIQAIITLEKTNRKTAIKKYNDRHHSASTYSFVTKTTNNNTLNCNEKEQPTTSNAESPDVPNQMLPPNKSKPNREIRQYSDVEISDNESSSSQTIDDSKTKKLIVPIKTSKRTRKQLTKEANSNGNKRTKNL